MQRPSLMKEFWDFLKENKKWWLLPIVIVLALLALLIYLGSSQAATYIYPIW